MDTFWWNFEFSAPDDLDIFCWSISASRLNILNTRDYLVTLENLAEDNVRAIEMTVRWLEVR